MRQPIGAPGCVWAPLSPPPQPWLPPDSHTTAWQPFLSVAVHAACAPDPALLEGLFLFIYLFSMQYEEASVQDEPGAARPVNSSQGLGKRTKSDFFFFAIKSRENAAERPQASQGA